MPVTVLSHLATWTRIILCAAQMPMAERHSLKASLRSPGVYDLCPQQPRFASKIADRSLRGAADTARAAAPAAFCPLDMRDRRAVYSGIFSSCPG
jgi:hypothetical protein